VAGVPTACRASAVMMSSVPSTVLVVGGTGMLSAAVRQLLRFGRTVVLVARRASEFEAPAPSSGRLITVDADWRTPQRFAEAVGQAARGLSLEAAVIWVHRPYRDQIVRELDDLLPPGAVVLRLWGSGGGDPEAEARAAVRLAGRRMREVYLGSVTEAHSWRWLTHEEISAGALQALEGENAHHVIGELTAR
jgi:NADPH:quinone reductase-like Zn-dependent oxidoreductase